MTDELLTIQDLANLFRCTYRCARDIKVKLVGFPKPAPGSSARIPLWLRSEVRAFLHGKETKTRKNPALQEIRL